MPIDFPSSPSMGQVYTFGSRTWTWTGYGWQATSTTQGPQGIQGLQGVQGAAGAVAEVQYLDDLQPVFDGVTSRFRPTYQNVPLSVTNPFRLDIALNGLSQRVSNSLVVWDNPTSRYNWIRVDDGGFLVFSQPPAAGTTFFGRVLVGPTTTSLTTTYPFAAADLLVGAF